ncbi:hypothetical protein P872_06055 [Rhodonellum psychrophilum GCM71 = DSM 17998]|uniref:Uncharacterized protein n=2 Tax=Rhodonellum TaxID=336827 RepID=U5BZP2_9BACT|nr:MULTISPECIES: hypothetical protein [Rhodonellum]ERM83034.1 hypothetical protein P872_06055 [Rhodonellum psychrophilum GCM71 = DSM 17998]SDZ47588.1 hypothetical protein SAMN05444412_11660 [Rhodonellum ikkaensis]
MKTVKEGFDLLDFKGVDREVQHLFSNVWTEDEFGRLKADYLDAKGEKVDEEILYVSGLKFSAQGILHFATADPSMVKTVLISDAVANLVFFAKAFHQRLRLDYCSFIATGCLPDKNMFLKTLNHYPFANKFHSIFGNSLFGKVRDCKIQHWIQGKDCSFRIDGEKVIAQYLNREYSLPIKEFSLRNHLRQLSVRQSLSTYKPGKSSLENYWEINL